MHNRLLIQNPGLMKLSNEMYLRSNHPFHYAQLLLGELLPRISEFSLTVQRILEYYAGYLETATAYRNDILQSGFCEYLHLTGKNILNDQQLDKTEQIEILTNFYNIYLLIDKLELFHEALSQNDRQALFAEILSDK